MSQLTPEELAQSFACYLPPAVTRRILDTPRLANEPYLERFPAAVLFADVSGYTELLERLSATGPHGAEELTLLLNKYFSRMIGILEAEGGEVVQFSGDALFSVFADAQDELEAINSDVETALRTGVRRAWQAAEQMQAAMAEFADLLTSQGHITLGMKITIGAGEISALAVGGVRQHWQYVVAGPPLQQVSKAAEEAERGQILLSPEAADLFADAPLPSRPLPPFLWSNVSPGLIEALHSHIPEIVAYRLMAGQAHWLAELRSLSILFIGIAGLDYSADALGHVQAWVESCQTTIYRYGGSLNKLLVDDKGTVAMVLFGAPPYSHEDDPLRAVRCALELQEVARRHRLELAIGITTGQSFAGPVGSDSRREYTVIGDTVNLATRLMQQAGPGQIHGDFATYQATRDTISWQALLPQTVKGKAAAVRIYRPLGIIRGSQGAVAPFPLAGREKAVDQINRMFDNVLAGELQVLVIEGEAGMGKSRLIEALIQRTREEGLVGLMGNGDALEQQTPYNAWREVFRSYFDLENISDSPEQRVKVIERLAEVAPNLRERVALLNDLLGLGLPENNLTNSFVPKLRQASLTSLLIELLEVWTNERPLVLVLEDAQWLDSLSWRLTLQVARSLPNVPLFLVIAMRPLAETPADHPIRPLASLDQCEKLVLRELSPADTVKLVANQIGVEELPLEIANFIARRATGNPFVAQELARSLQNSSAIRIVNGQCMLAGHLSELQVPDTLHGLVLSRIDRLPAREQLVLKVASVIGRTFGYATLRHALASRLADVDLQNALDGLVDYDMVQTLDAPTSLRSHTFKQAILQEVTYSTLLRTQRRELHERTAQWYEMYATTPDLYPLLAHHWRLALEPNRELGYAVLAGHKLAADYANSEALSFLNRALELSDDDPTRYELLLLRLEVHERIGDRKAQEEDLQALQLLAGQAEAERQVEIANCWADYYRNGSDYQSSMIALRSARAISQRIGDQAGEARSLTIWGQTLEHQGKYKEARGYLEQALELCRHQGDHGGEAENLSRISNICRYLGDITTAETYALEALRLRRNIGDRAKEAVSLYNLGLIALEMGRRDAAAAYREQALQLSQAIGDRASEALSLSAIGQGHLMKGDYAAAQRHLQQALRLYQVMGERRSEANCLNLLGMLWRDVGNDRNAQRSFEQALAIQEEIGSHSFSAYTYLNLGLVNLQLNAPMTHVCYSKALRAARETGNRDAEAYALSYRAGLHGHLGRWDAAQKDYLAALAIREELQTSAAAMEDTAGLARVARAQEDLVAAREYSQQCLSYISEAGVEGMEFPLEVYLTCYDILRAGGEHDKAMRVLEEAHQLLIRRADAISDPIMRDGMLHNVPTNQRVLAEWYEQSIAQTT